jgi:methylated-DNA-[protein]-cysteine S-methyltransferase
VVIDLVVATTASTQAYERLHDRLVERAERERLLDVSYRTVDSPFGPLLLAATTKGLVRVAFDREGHDAVLARLATEVSPRILHAARPWRTRRRSSTSLPGRRRGFDMPIDLRLANGFRRTVLRCLRRIAYGHTESYATVAEAAGKPNAARAVGSACSHNPLPIVVPCHRVVRSDGSIGEYLGGTEVKSALLTMEAGA